MRLMESWKNPVAKSGSAVSRSSVSAIALLILAISGCQKTDAVTLALSFEESNGELRIHIANRGVHPLLVGDHFLGLVNRSPGDLSIFVSKENGELVPQCRSYDYFSPESVVTIRGGETLLLSTHIDAVTYTHCLNSPGTYVLRAGLGGVEGHGLNEAVSSNVLEVAVSPEDVRRRTISMRQTETAENQERGDGR